MYLILTHTLSQDTFFTHYNNTCYFLPTLTPSKYVLYNYFVGETCKRKTEGIKMLLVHTFLKNLIINK